MATKLERRIRSLEDDRLRIKTWLTVLVFCGSAGSIAAALVGRLFPS